MYNLFLDDVREPHKVSWVKLPKVEWRIARNYAEFTDVIKKHGVPNFVAYDHDLADEHYNSAIDTEKYREKTGYDCALYLINICSKKNEKHPNYVVHSMNPVGKKRIEDSIKIYNNSFNFF